MLGLGTDIVDIERLRQSVQRTGEHFLTKVYSPAELEHLPPEGRRRDEFLAGRWAVKEALAKALHCGITEHCRLADITTLNDPVSGAPITTIKGAALKTAQDMGVRHIWTSIAHEKNFAVATVIVE